MTVKESTSEPRFRLKPVPILVTAALGYGLPLLAAYAAFYASQILHTPSPRGPVLPWLYMQHGFQLLVALGLDHERRVDNYARGDDVVTEHMLAALNARAENAGRESIFAVGCWRVDAAIRAGRRNVGRIRSMNQSQSAIQPSVWNRISHWTLMRIFIMAVMLLIVVIVAP